MSEARPSVPALERGLDILRLFKRSRPHIAPPEIARELEIPRSTVHRLMLTLEAMGFLRRLEGGGAFALGPSVLSIGFEYLGSLDIVALSDPALAKLRDDTGCSTHLAIRNGTDMVYLSRHATRAGVTSNVSVGSTLPAHATVIGRVSLADLDRDALAALYGGKPLARVTRHTPTTLAALEKLLVEDRRRGYAVSTSFYEPGVISVAAPVRDQGSRVVASINAVTVDPRMEETAHGALKDRVVATASSISAMLGAPAGAPPRHDAKRFGT